MPLLPRSCTGRLAAGVAALAVLAACEAPTSAAPESLSATFSVAPVVAPGLASFAGSLIDNARIRVVRPLATADATTQVEGVLDTIIPFPAESSKVSLRLRVPLRARSEKLLIVVDLRLATTPLLSGSELVEVFAIGAGPAPQPRPVLIYVGPGQTVRTLRIDPGDTVLTFGSSLTFRLSGLDQNNTSVSDLLVRWSTSSALVPITQTGILTAPSTRGTLFVKAETPTGIADTVRVRFAPAPTQVVALGGASQIAAAGTVLPQLLQVQVRAADGLGVPGVVVRFRVLLGGGGVGNLFVLTDDTGEAKTSAQLGPLAGANAFEASVAGLPVVVFTATGL